jgi:hypothetical protein
MEAGIRSLESRKGIRGTFLRRFRYSRRGGQTRTLTARFFSGIKRREYRAEAVCSDAPIFLNLHHGREAHASGLCQRSLLPSEAATPERHALAV